MVSPCSFFASAVVTRPAWRKVHSMYPLRFAFAEHGILAELPGAERKGLALLRILKTQAEGPHTRGFEGDLLDGHPVGEVNIFVVVGAHFVSAIETR